MLRSPAGRWGQQLSKLTSRIIVFLRNPVENGLVASFPPPRRRSCCQGAWLRAPGWERLRAARWQCRRRWGKEPGRATDFVFQQLDLSLLELLVPTVLQREQSDAGEVGRRGESSAEDKLM